MAVIILSPLQNLKCLKIAYKCMKPPEVVFGWFYITRSPIVKQHLIRDIMCQTRKIYAISEIFLLQKGSHDTKTHCGYLISLVSTETHFYENYLRQRLS